MIIYIYIALTSILLGYYYSKSRRLDREIKAIFKADAKQQIFTPTSALRGITSSSAFNDQTLKSMRLAKAQADTTRQLIHFTAAQNNKYMPNGFESWHETHFEITSAIVKSVNWSGSKARHVSETEGTGGLYELARDLTNKFERDYQGKEWGVDDDTQYFDEIAKFLKENLKPVR